MISTLNAVVGWVDLSGNYDIWFDQYSIARKCKVCKAVKVKETAKSIKVAKKIAKKELLLEQYQAALNQKVAFTVTECNLDLSSDKIDLYDISYFEYDDKYNDIQWSSSNPSVATISSDWIVEPKSIGTTIITAKATFSGKTSSIVVNVADMTSFSLYTETECLDGKTINYNFSEFHYLNSYKIYPVFSYKDGREKYPISYKVEGDSINIEKTEVGNYYITFNKKIGVSKITFYNKACSREVIFNVTGSFPFSLVDYKETIDLEIGNSTTIKAQVNYENADEPIRYEIEGNSVSVKQSDSNNYTYYEKASFQITANSIGTSKVRFYNSTTSYTVVFNVHELFNIKTPEILSGDNVYLGEGEKYLYIHMDWTPTFWSYESDGGEVIKCEDGNYLLCGEKSTYYLVSKYENDSIIVELWNEKGGTLLETLTMVNHYE